MMHDLTQRLAKLGTDLSGVFVQRQAAPQENVRVRMHVRLPHGNVH